MSALNTTIHSLFRQVENKLYRDGSEFQCYIHFNSDNKLQLIGTEVSLLNFLQEVLIESISSELHACIIKTVMLYTSKPSIEYAHLGPIILTWNNIVIRWQTIKSVL